jgi:predicted nuclease of predicted toxin-antitoxin system
MRFLLDQDVYWSTATLLLNLGHDVVTAAQKGMARSGDEAVLDAAREDRRILVTRDRDFGALVFVRGLRAGVVCLRVSPATLNSVHAELARVLEEHTEAELLKAFAVVEPGRHRVRRNVMVH